MIEKIEDVPAELEYTQHVEHILKALNIHDVDADRLVNDALDIAGCGQYINTSNERIAANELCILAMLCNEIRGHHIHCDNPVKLWNWTCEDEEDKINA